MEFDEKLQAALHYLEASGIPRRNYAPPIFRILWRLGLRVPPPHYASFASNFLMTGPYFGIAWGLGMWLVFRSRHPPVAIAATIAALAGVAFGISMATFYRASARRHSIPGWTKFQPDG